MPRPCGAGLRVRPPPHGSVPDDPQRVRSVLRYCQREQSLIAVRACFRQAFLGEARVVDAGWLAFGNESRRGDSNPQPLAYKASAATS